MWLTRLQAVAWAFVLAGLVVFIVYIWVHETENCPVREAFNCEVMRDGGYVSSTCYRCAPETLNAR